MAIGSFGYAWRIEPHWVETVRRPLPLAGLSPGLIGKRIVQISDIHAGPVVDQRWLLDVLEQVAELEPDLIALTGDFMTCLGEESIPKALEAIDALPRAPLGNFAVMGNHDYGRGFRQHRIADKLCNEFQRRQIRVLSNEVADIEGLQIAGVDDLWSGRFSPERMLNDLDGDSPAIALCHNPDGADHVAWRDFHGWILAGHTHGGQCKAPFFRPPIVPVRNKRYYAGQYDLGPGRRMYINRGLGYLRRIRFNVRPELTVFTLTAV